MSVTDNRNMAGTATRKNVFISYRVKDTAAATGRLADALKMRLEEDQIFMDIDKLEPGVDFTHVISRTLDVCDVMLAVIGPDWIGYNPDTKRSRIKDDNDWVRLELATALKRNIRVVPVLIDGGILPDTNDLPEDLQPLLRRQSCEITNKRWKYDTDQLIDFLEKTCGIYGKKRPQNQPNLPPPAKPRSTGKTIGIIAVVLLVLMIIGALAPQEQKNADPVNPKQEEPQTGYDNNNNPPVVNPGGNKPAQVQDANISGRWQDPVNTGVFVFQQDGRNLQLIVYSGTGEQTGSGSGYVTGKTVHLDVNIVMVGAATIEATVSQDEKEMNGQIKMQQNGASYSEPIRMVR